MNSNDIGTTTNQGEHPAQSISFLGIVVNPQSLEDLMRLVETKIARGERCVIANHNLHSLYLVHREPRLSEFYEIADYTHIDGMPIVALGRLYGHRVLREHRVTYVDWIDPLMVTAAEKNWRVFYLGSAPGVAEAGAQKLRLRFPGLEIRTRHGYFNVDSRALENEEVLTAISEYKPNLLMIGMGMPRQEHWIRENLRRLPECVILPSGAAMDYVAGGIRTPPRWAGRLGLEWAFRLADEPRRLSRRYLLEPWSVLGIVVQDVVHRIWNLRPSPSTEK